MGDFWENFFHQANPAARQGMDIGARAALQSMADKIQQRYKEKEQLWESLENEKKQRFQADLAAKHQAFLAAENEKDRLSRESTDNQSIDSAYAKLVTTKPRAQWNEIDLQVESEYKAAHAPKPEKTTFNKDEFLRSQLGDQGYLKYLMKEDTGGEVRKPEQARIMAEDIIGKEEGTLPKEIADLQGAINTPTNIEQEVMKPELQSSLATKESELARIQAKRPGGLPALTDSLRLGQGRFATPEQLNTEVSPEDAASVTQELAILKQTLAELLNALGQKK